MSAGALSFALSACVLLIAIVHSAENAYQELNVKLPVRLMGPITAVYNDMLFVFGGKLENSDEQWNTQFWKLDLSQIEMDGTADIMDVPSSFEELSVTAPTYGDSTTNEFYCENQCSGVIGQYLYVVSPRAQALSFSDVTEIIYRLDLSQDPPVFAAASDFASTLSYAETVNDNCVTVVDDVLYVLTGSKSNVYSLEGEKYDPSLEPSEEAQTSLSLMPSTDTTYDAGRANAGCAGAIGGDAIYLFGGEADGRTYGAPGIDTYDVMDDVWTENSMSRDWDKSNGDSQGKNTRNSFKCFSRHTRTVECVGGAGIVGGSFEAADTSIVWSYDTSSEEYVSLAVGVWAPGLAIYDVMNDGDNAATLVLVIGGSVDPTVMFNGTDIIQYAVRYAAITERPTTSPTAFPTALTSGPTPAPSRSPLCNGCSHDPSASPSKYPSTSPTEPTSAPIVVGEGSSGAVRFWSVFTFVVVMISAVLYV